MASAISLYPYTFGWMPSAQNKVSADLLYWIVLFLVLVIGFLILRFCKEKIKKE